MYKFALFVHILGWAQWMASQLALSGLLRREYLFNRELGPRLAPALRALYISLWVGLVMALAGAGLLISLDMNYFKQGFVHAKITLFLALVLIAVIPIRQAYKNLELGGAPQKSLWFIASLVGFVLAIFLGVYKPF